MSMPMLAGVGLMMVCCSSLSSFMTMGDDTKKKEDDSDSDSDSDDDADADGSPDPYATFCDVAKTDWINGSMQEDGWSQSQGEAAQKCKVPENLQARIEPVAFCDVAKTDWINGSIQEDGWTQGAGEAAQKCKVPENLQSRIQ